VKKGGSAGQMQFCVKCMKCVADMPVHKPKCQGGSSPPSSQSSTLSSPFARSSISNSRASGIKRPIAVTQSSSSDASSSPKSLSLRSEEELIHVDVSSDDDIQVSILFFTWS
jgi:hypothetical protein